MKRIKKILTNKDTWVNIVFFIILVFIILLCVYGIMSAIDSIGTNTDDNTNIGTGQCLEYETQYKLDCGIFVGDSFCKERKYEVCVRWENDEL